MNKILPLDKEINLNFEELDKIAPYVREYFEKTCIHLYGNTKFFDAMTDIIDEKVKDILKDKNSL